MENVTPLLPLLVGLEVTILAHMLGHLLFAWGFGVPVELHLGFGPALPRCRFRWGRMIFLLAVFPLGGYVRITGPPPALEQDVEGPPPVRAVPVWRRLAVVPGGIAASILFAILCFGMVFRGPGKQLPAAVVGMVVPGSPAWEKGVPAGAWIHQIGNHKGHPLYFTDILPEVMLSSEGEELSFVYSNPPEQTENTTITLLPRRAGRDDHPLVGILGAESLKLLRQRDLLDHDHPVYLKSAAAWADPPFEFEDEIVGCTDPARRQKGWHQDWQPLPRDQRNVQESQPDYFVFARRLRDLAGQPLTVRVRRLDGEEVSIRVPPAFHYSFGLKMQMGPITAVRKNSSADTWQDKQQPIISGEGRTGDVIEQVEVAATDGKIQRFLFPSPHSVHTQEAGTVLDPAQLRFHLQKWALTTKGDKTVTLKVRRENLEVGHQYQGVTLNKRWDEDPRWTYTQEVPFALDAPLSVPELGIAFQVLTTVSAVDPKFHPALAPGDVIKGVRFFSVGKNGEERGPSRGLEPDQWAHAFWTFQHFTDFPKIAVMVNDSPEEMVLEAHPDNSWPLADRGLILSRDIRSQRSDNLLEAAQLGFTDICTKMGQVYKSVCSLVNRRISRRTLGGPVTIVRVSYNLAGESWWEFVYFLGLLSINLAMINLLPLPLLDGGEVLLLGYEKLRGRPVSGTVRVVAYCLGGAVLGLLLLWPWGA
jgi:regulator of sigma E protease